MIKFLAGAATITAIYLAGWSNIERIGSAVGAAAQTVLANAQERVEGIRK